MNRIFCSPLSNLEISRYKFNAMKNLQFKTVRELLLAIFATTIFMISDQTQACTIVSAIDKNGQVWNANNEDGPFGVSNYINVFPKTETTTYGYFTLCYLSPQLGHGAAIQGGMNEAGLTFDFNAIDAVKLSETQNKKPFEGGNDAILPYILGHFETTEQVIKFFETYWFEDGFTSAQMHVADRQGNFAIISASGIQRSKKADHLISTNFDICGKEDGSYCWRYPLAERLLAEQEVNFKTMKDICVETAQKEGQTMYSNIQNLSTGDLWFFSKHDPENLVHTTINDLLKRGQKFYSFSQLDELIQEETQREAMSYEVITLSEETLNNYQGTYQNSFAGQATVQAKDNAIELCMVGFPCEKLLPIGNDTFKSEHFDLYIRFEKEDETITQFKLYENGYWSFTAEKKLGLK